MDEPVRRGATHTFRTDCKFQRVVDFVEFIRGTPRLVRAISHHPEPVCPGNHCTGSAFSLVVVITQVRIDSAEFRLVRYDAIPFPRTGNKEGEGCGNCKYSIVFHRFTLLPRILCSKVSLLPSARCLAQRLPFRQECGRDGRHRNCVRQMCGRNRA